MNKVFEKYNIEIDNERQIEKYAELVMRFNNNIKKLANRGFTSTEIRNNILKN